MMERLVVELQSTNSSKEKVGILKAREADDQIKEALRLCYDPFSLSFINKLPKQMAVGTKTFATGFTTFEKIYVQLSSRQVTGNDARSLVLAFFNTCTAEAATIFGGILRSDLRIGCGASTCNKVWPKLIKKFEIQLANKYEADRNYKGVEYWYASPKLDGIRCIFINGGLYTRSGKPVVGFDFITEELTRALDRIGLDFIDGELYSHEIGFQDIQGAVVRNKNVVVADKEKIFFNVFAVGSLDRIMSTADMVSTIEVIAKMGLTHVIPLDYTVVDNTHEAIADTLKEYEFMGYEGAMLRHPTTSYAWKRTHDLVKVKSFQEEDFAVLGFEPGTGKYADTLGSIKVWGEVSGVKVFAKVGSGLDDEMRAEIWNNQDKYIGQKAEVKFQNVTDKENENGEWSLRFPIFLKWKLDR